MSAQRRGQVGAGSRTDKIRTYNYKENRVTDHRINLTLYKLDQVLAGDLTELTDALMADKRARQLERRGGRRAARDAAGRRDPGRRWWPSWPRWWRARARGRASSSTRRSASGVVLGHPSARRGALDADAVGGGAGHGGAAGGGGAAAVRLRALALPPLDLLVDPRVLIPRPETEQVVEVALAEARRLRLAAAPRAAGISWWSTPAPGSGAIALALAAELGAGACARCGPPTPVPARSRWPRPNLEARAASRRTAAALLPERRARRGQLARAAARPPARRGRPGRVQPAVCERGRVGRSSTPEVRAEPRQALVAGPASDGTPGLADVEAVLDAEPGLAGRPGGGGAGAPPGRGRGRAGPRLGFDGGPGRSGTWPGRPRALAGADGGAARWRPGGRWTAGRRARETAPSPRWSGAGARRGGAARWTAAPIIAVPAVGGYCLAVRAGRTSGGAPGRPGRRPRGPALRGRPRRRRPRADLGLERRAEPAARAVLARTGRGLPARGRRAPEHGPYDAEADAGGLGRHRGHARGPGAAPALPRARPVAHGAAPLHRGRRGRRTPSSPPTWRWWSTAARDGRAAHAGRRDGVAGPRPARGCPAGPSSRPRWPWARVGACSRVRSGRRQAERRRGVRRPRPRHSSVA